MNASTQGFRALSERPVVRVALLWHMHQPLYRDPKDGAYILPWVRLHALKDYWGMVAILEETPDVHVTFNLVPSLVDQIEDYVLGRAPEAELRLGLQRPDSLGEAEKAHFLRSAFMAHPQNLIGRFPRFAELHARRGAEAGEAALRAAARRFSADDLRDLQVLSKLAWFDLDWVKRDPIVRGLIEKGRGYDERDKALLADRERALLGAVLPAYRKAAEEGRVELSASPYYHPILPLLCDTNAHHEAHPGALVPRRFQHPEDAADQIRRAIFRHAEAFGSPPAGMWPSEGSVSEAAVREIARAGLRWTASDEGVLQHSLGQPLHRDSRGTAHPAAMLYRPWVRRTDQGEVTLFFRDRALSDLIGFSYSGMEPDHAAQDLLDRVRRIGEQWRREGQGGDPVVPIILDGENAWEHFREGGRVFLRHLYQGLQEDPGLAAVTMSEAMNTGESRALPRVFAGSWIHADFSVWIGHADDRRAWELLADARDALTRADAAGSLPAEARARAHEAYRAACGSDWCWWYGEDHSSENDLEFDRLFRRHLRAIYDALERPAPQAIAGTLITTRHFEPRQSLPAGEVAPTFDGRISPDDEWGVAGVYRAPLAGAMHRAGPSVREVRFATGGGRLCVLVEAMGAAVDLLGQADIVLAFTGPPFVLYRFRRAPNGVAVTRETMFGPPSATTSVVAAVDAVLEVAIPLEELPVAEDDSLTFAVLVALGETELERHPETGPITLTLEVFS